MSSDAHTAPSAPIPDGLLEPDMQRRRLLSVVTATVGTIGIAIAAVPFIESLEPSESGRARGAPVNIDIGKLQPRQMLSVLWREKPIWVLRRTQEQIAGLPKLNDRLKDPLSKQLQQPPELPNWNAVQRSINPEFLLVVGICTHLGCIPKYRPDAGSATLGANWPGGFFCPCHGSRYDLAGRVMDGSPAPLNLPVPPYYYRHPTLIVAGSLADGSQQNWSPDAW